MNEKQVVALVKALEKIEGAIDLLGFGMILFFIVELVREVLK